MIATLAEMESAKVPLDARDYCAHMLINLRSCIRDNFPLNYRCHHEREEYYECQYHEYVLDAKVIKYLHLKLLVLT